MQRTLRIYSYKLNSDESLCDLSAIAVKMVSNEKSGSLSSADTFNDKASLSYANYFEDDSP